MFLKGCKYIEKKVITRINSNLSDFSTSHESDEEQIRISSFKKKLGLYFRKYMTLFFKRGMDTKTVYCIFKNMFTMH